MKEYVENKLFISFLIFIGSFTYFVGINNNRQMKDDTNNRVYVEK